MFVWNAPIDAQRFDALGSFLGGAVGSIWTLASILLLIETIRLQNKQIGDAEMIRREDRFLVYLDKFEMFLDRISIIDSRQEGRQRVNGRDVFRVWSSMLDDSTKAITDPVALEKAIAGFSSKFKVPMNNYSAGVTRLLSITNATTNSAETKESMLTTLRHSLTTSELKVYMYMTRYKDPAAYQIFKSQMMGRVDQMDLLCSSSHANLFN